MFSSYNKLGRGALSLPFQEGDLYQVSLIEVRKASFVYGRPVCTPNLRSDTWVRPYNLFDRGFVLTGLSGGKLIPPAPL
jgi:hypothetical protein